MKVARVMLFVLIGVSLVYAADAPAKKSADEPAKKGATAPTKKARAPSPSLQPIKDEPGLPRVLLIGDSISMGYTLAVREQLAGKANVHRIPTNGGPTIKGLEAIDSWLGDSKWDVIHFNWGLHDLKMMDTGMQQVPLPEYEANLKKLVARMKQTGAKLIWCTTTPFPKGGLTPTRKYEDLLAYNAVALKVMKANDVAIDDLCAFAEPQLDKIQIPENVHFTGEGSAVLAQQVSRSILDALGKN